MALSGDAKTVRQLRKHPLAMRALDLLLSKNAPLHLQEIAQNLGVHKVSAHRTMSGLTDLKLVKVQGGTDARYRYFTIPESKKHDVKQLISATKQASHIPIGRALLSVGSAVQDQVTQELSANGLTVKLASPTAPYDILIQTGKATVGLDIKIITGSLSERRFNEIVGRIMTSTARLKQRQTFLVIALIGVDDDDLAETGRRLETQLHDGFGLDVKFLWVPVQPLDLDSPTISKTVVEPIIKILDDWRLRRPL
ncbi:MAG: helix-turn-helix domain-containing protein [Candidatus Bathyarchaeia archaeon]